MANDVAGGGGGGSGGGSDSDGLLGRVVTIDPDGKGFDVKWLAVFSAGVSGVVLAWFEAITGVFVGLSTAVETVFGAVQQRTVAVLEALFQSVGVMDAAWAAATVEVADSGLFAFPLAVGVAGATHYIYSLGVSLLVE